LASLDPVLHSQAGKLKLLHGILVVADRSPPMISFACIFSMII